MRALALTTSVPTTHWKYKPDYHIHYEKYAHLPLERIPHGASIDTLMMSGGHGSFAMNMLNELPKSEIVRLCKHLKSANTTKLKNIVLDCCDSAQFIPQFKDLLTDNGIIFCDLSDSPNHYVYNLLGDSYEQYKNVPLGMAMQDIISRMHEQYQYLPLDIERNYPEVYSKKNNCLYYYGEVSSAVVSHLQRNGIKLVQIKYFDQYIDKIIELSQHTVPLSKHASPKPKVKTADEQEAEINALMNLAQKELTLYENTLRCYETTGCKARELEQASIHYAQYESAISSIEEKKARSSTFKN